MRLDSFTNSLENTKQPLWIQQHTSKDFHGGLGAKLSTYMIDNAPVISACIDGMVSTISEATWKLEGDEVPQETLKIFEDLLERIDFSNKVKDIASFIPYGWSAFEIVFGKPEKNIPFPIIELATIRQESLECWIGDTNNKVIGMKVEKREKGIPIEKLALFRDVPNRGNVEGKGLLRSCFSIFKIVQELKTILVEQHRCHKNNFVKAHVPLSLFAKLSGGNCTNAADREAALGTMRGINEMAEKIARGEGASVVIPSDQFSYVDGGEVRFGGRAQFDIDVQALSSNEITILEAIKYYEQQMLTGLSSEHKLVGVGESGSKSSGEVHKSTAETIIAGHCKTICTMFTQFLHFFASINGIPKDHVPTLVVGDIDKSNINFKINAAQTVIHASEKGFTEIARSIARDANLPEDDIKDAEEMVLDDSLHSEFPDLNIQNPGQQLRHEKG